MPKVFLGVGHGGNDPGACANGLKEKDINLAIALPCRDVLVQHGVQVLMSRTGDENDDLSEEIRECRAYNPDYAVDIHNNAGGGDGFEAIYSIFQNQTGGKDKLLASNIEKEVVAIGQNTRGLKTRKDSSTGRDYFGFIREMACPSIIVECAFLDSNDRFIVDTAQEQKAFGVAIAKGILKTLGIAYKGGATTSATTNTSNSTSGSKAKWRVSVGAFADIENAKKKCAEMKAKGIDATVVPI